MANINFGFEHHASKLYSGAIEQGIQNSLVPMVIETSGRGERAFDIFRVCFVSASFSLVAALMNMLRG